MTVFFLTSFMSINLRKSAEVKFMVTEGLLKPKQNSHISVILLIYWQKKVV